jgi:hypothetical protein
MLLWFLKECNKPIWHHQAFLYGTLDGQQAKWKGKVKGPKEGPVEGHVICHKFF